MTESHLSQQQLEEVARRLEAASDRAVWSGTDWLDALAISRRCGRTPDDVQRQLAGWESERKVFSLQRDGARVYPLYGFSDDFTPLPVLTEVWAVLSRHSPVWLAGWFESTSAFLGGARPRELVRTRPDLVIAAAKAAYEAEEYC